MSPSRGPSIDETYAEEYVDPGKDNGVKLYADIARLAATGKIVPSIR